MKLKTVNIKACAKINLSLDITGVREDGYHLLETVMQSVDLCDYVTINLCNDIFVKSSVDLLGGQDDICYKAAQLFFQKSNILGGAEIVVTKNIPLSAGLGGGSADAAAVLVGLNKLYGMPLSFEELLELAVNLGADVPYFLYGGTVFASGIGEICKKLSDMPLCYIVLAKREQKKSTKYMYSVIDNANKPIKVNTCELITAICDNNLCKAANACVNEFSVAWDDDVTTNVLKSFNPLCVSLSGSGPTHFAIFNDKAVALKCVDALKRKNIEAFLTVPTDSAIIIE